MLLVFLYRGSVCLTHPRSSSVSDTSRYGCIRQCLKRLHILRYGYIRHSNLCILHLPDSAPLACCSILQRKVFRLCFLLRQAHWRWKASVLR